MSKGWHAGNPTVEGWLNPKPRIFKPKYATWRNVRDEMDQDPNFSGKGRE